MDGINLNPAEKDTLNNRGYQLLSKIGEGAYAKVYLSTYKKSQSKLACKIVDIPKSSATYVSKFLPRELDILMTIKSPYIIHIHSIFRRHLKYFIFMNFAENGDLMDWIVEHGPLSQIQSKFWTKQILAAMEYLHTLRIAHRDIKCENILITEKKNVKLTDFGFSKYIIENDSDKSVVSETFCGSMMYVSPEIIKGIAYDPFKSDIWSLGVVIFTMLNRMVPFNETNPSVIYDLQMKQKYKFRCGDNSLELAKNLVKQLLQPKPNRRPSIDMIRQHYWLTMDDNEIETTQLKGSEKDEENLLKDSETTNDSSLEYSESSDVKSSESTKTSNENSLENVMKTDEDVKTIDAHNSQEKVHTSIEVKNEKNHGNEVVSSLESGMQIISKSFLAVNKITVPVILKSKEGSQLNE